MLLSAILISLTAAASLPGPFAVAVRWSETGLASIQFDNHEYLSYGVMTLSRIRLEDAPGHTIPATTEGNRVVDSAKGCARLVLPWGVVTTDVQTEYNRMALAITVHNTSSAVITELSMEPFRIRLNDKPAQYNGNVPILADNLSGPSVWSLSTSSSRLVLTNEDPTLPLSIGFPWAIDKPQSREFPVRIVTGREPMYPDSVPFIDRPIGPGGSDVYKLSLTFGSGSDQVDELVAGIGRRIAGYYPPVLRWPDRRPIGAIMLATANAHWPLNPRGWFLNSSLDVTHPAGKRAFRTELMKWADTSILNLRGMKAQGAITWDIEGEEFAHPATYVGDPRLLDSLDPEMEACVDEYFKRFRDAGLRVGVTIRPQQFIRSTDGNNATQQPVADPARLLSDKISYAKKRWNATLFYVDSNGDPNFPMDFRILRAVAKENPDILLIPEHSGLFYYAFSAPYGELRRGVTSAPTLARQLYPEAFRVVNTSDGPLEQQRQRLTMAVQQGDVLMFRAWFADPANRVIQTLVKTSHN
jgi:hypothetical protein